MSKRIILGEMDIGQYIYRSTGTILPKHRQRLLARLLELTDLGYIVFDVGASTTRTASLGILVPRRITIPKPSEESDAIFVADMKDDECSIGLMSMIPMTNIEFKLGKKKNFDGREFPRQFFKRIVKIPAWKTMQIVYIVNMDSRLDHIIDFLIEAGTAKTS